MKRAKQRWAERVRQQSIILQAFDALPAHLSKIYEASRCAAEMRECGLALDDVRESARRFIEQRRLARGQL